MSEIDDVDEEENEFTVIEKIPKIRGMWTTSTKYLLKAGSASDKESWIEVVALINENKKKSGE